MSIPTSFARSLFIVATLSSSSLGCSASVEPGESADMENAEALKTQGPRFLDASSSGSLCPPGALVPRHNPYDPAPLSIIVNAARMVPIASARCSISASFEIAPGYQMTPPAWTIRGAARAASGAAPEIRFLVSNGLAGASSTSRQTMVATFSGSSDWSGQVASVGPASSNCSGKTPKKVTWTLELAADTKKGPDTEVLVDALDSYTTSTTSCSP